MEFMRILVLIIFLILNTNCLTMYESVRRNQISSSYGLFTKAQGQSAVNFSKTTPHQVCLPMKTSAETKTTPKRQVIFHLCNLLYRRIFVYNNCFSLNTYHLWMLKGRGTILKLFQKIWAWHTMLILFFDMALKTHNLQKLYRLMSTFSTQKFCNLMPSLCKVIS